MSNCCKWGNKKKYNLGLMFEIIVMDWKTFITRYNIAKLGYGTWLLCENTTCTSDYG